MRRVGRRVDEAGHRCAPSVMVGVVVFVVAAVAAACSSPSLPAATVADTTVSDPTTTADSDPTTSSGSTDAPAGSTDAPVASTDAPTEPGLGVVVDAAASAIPIDRRLLGTNVPAWLGPERLAAPWFREAIEAAGVTSLRMPGGSWSNEYDWLACELGDADECIWTGAARPSDFAALLDETGLIGVWTVSINETAQHAAAAVAFFNGTPGDDTAIGLDRDGVDWGTVADWASMRVDAGVAEPVGIRLWEIGNEVYGGRPDTGGEQCSTFGWETAWTCDGREYVLGDGEHDGYLDIRRAMLAVDPTISVGAVGVSAPEAWSDWGNEVIDAAGPELDFYIVHHYGFDASPNPSDVAAAAALWSDVVESTRGSLPDDVPIAVTEYNLVSVEAGDTERTMTRAMNALFVADSIGQLAARGVPIANHWNLANGTTGSGTDYGLIDADDGSRFPQFEGLAVWGRAGDELLEARPVGELGQTRVYPTRHPDGSLSVIILRFDGEPQALSVRVDGMAASSTVTATSSTADDPLATTLRMGDPEVLGTVDEVVAVEVAPWSITVLEVANDG